MSAEGANNKLTRKKNVSRNLVWGFGGKFVSLLMPFLTRTALVYTFGMNYVGLNSLFTSLLTVLSFAELGIGSALVFAMYKPVAENDDAEVCALLAFYRKCYWVIGLVILLVGLALMPFLDKFASEGIPSDVNLQVLFAAYLANSVIGYFSSAYRSSLFTATQRVDVMSRITLVLSIASGLLQIAALVLVGSYYLYAFVLPCIAIANNACIGIISRRMYPQYYCEGHLEKAQIKSIGKNVIGLVFAKIGSVVLNATDSLVISIFLGLSILGMYNGYYVVLTAVVGVFSIIQQSLTPSVGNSLATEPTEKNAKDFSVFNFMYMWLATWAFCCLLGMLQPFIIIWQGEENTFGRLEVVLFCSWFLVQRCAEMSWIYRSAAGYWWQGKSIPLVQSLVNVGLSVALVQVMGVGGVVLATTISLLLINVPIGGWVLFVGFFESRDLFVNYVKESLAYLFKALIAGAVVYAVCEFVIIDGLAGLVLRLLICVLLPNILLLLINIRSKKKAEAIDFSLSLLPQRIRASKLVRLLVGLCKNSEA